MPPEVLGSLALLLEGVVFLLLQEQMLRDNKSTKPTRLREYLAVVLKLWGKHIAGPLLAVLTLILTFIAAYYAGDSSASAKVVKIAAWVTGIASAVLIFVAQYDAWSAERDRYENEVSKNQRPEIHGQARNFKWGGFLADSTPGTSKTVSFTVEFQLVLSNLRPVATNLCNISIVGRLLSRSVKYTQLDFEITTLNYGIAVVVPVTLMVSLDGLSTNDLKGKEVELEDTGIGVFDGFGDYHPIEILNYETIRF
jgi:hypothetical protein